MLFHYYDDSTIVDVGNGEWECFWFKSSLRLCLSMCWYNSITNGAEFTIIPTWCTQFYSTNGNKCLLFTW